MGARGIDRDLKYCMGYFDSRDFWRLVARQHGVVAHGQLVALGMHPQAVKRRVASGRLHRVWRGVYAVGRPEVGRLGRWTAAVLVCGDGALLGGETAAALAGEAAVNEADTLDLIDPEALRAALPDFAGVPGVAKLRRALDVNTFVLTRSALERHFLPVARRVGLLSKPIAGEWVNGFQVDFFWPELGLVIETDGLRYHRTPAKQAADLRRQQTHLAAGLWPLRFSHGQVAFEKGYVEETLRGMVERIGRAGTAGRT